MQKIPLHESFQARRALVVAGEDSGDLHGSNLIKACREIDGNLSFYGVGGQRMAAAGCEILFPNAEMAVVGAVEVFSRLPVILRAFKLLKNVLCGDAPPDVLILIDFPEFNLRLAAIAKRRGIPVLYYISPQVWAWRRYRVHRIAKVVDRLAAILPFEKDFYGAYGIDVEYVGHPLLDDFHHELSREAFLQKYHLKDGVPVIGLFPGSRKNELRYLLENILDAACILLKKRPEAQFVLPVAPSLSEEPLRKAIAARHLEERIRVLRDNIYDVARACDVVACVSGTVTLQIALAGTPMTILYRLSRLTYWLGRMLVKVPWIGLVNIVAGREVARELIQDDASPEGIAKEVLLLLEDGEYRRHAQDGLQLVREKLGSGGCSQRVARMASELSRRKTHG